MKKNPFLMLLLTLTLFIPIACQIDNVNQISNSNSSSIETVKDWFYKKHGFASFRLNTDENSKQPNWEKAKLYTFSFGEAWVIPIIYQKEYYSRYLNDNEKLKKEQKELKFKLKNSDLDYLLIKKDSKGFIERVISPIPDENYLAESNGMQKKLRYNGLMLIKDWNGNLIDLYKYSNGNVIGSYQKKKGKVSDFICETIDWYTCAAWEGGIDCHYTHSETSCYSTGGTNEDYPAPDFTNGTGGWNNDGTSGGTGDEYVDESYDFGATCKAGESLNEICQDFISRCRKGSILNEFPGQFLQVTISTVKNGSSAEHKKAWKLLNDGRFDKNK